MLNFSKIVNFRHVPHILAYAATKLEEDA